MEDKGFVFLKIGGFFSEEDGRARWGTGEEFLFHGLRFGSFAAILCQPLRGFVIADD